MITPAYESPTASSCIPYYLSSAPRAWHSHTTSEMTPDTQRKACLSCRQRKLKCDKQQPCANCTSRSVECREQLLPPVIRGVKRTLDESDQSTIPQILSRLDRLEAYVSRPQNNCNDGVVLDSFAHEVNTVRTQVSVVTSGSRTDRSIAGKANTSTSGNAQSETAEFVMPLGPFSANDNVLVCAEPSQLLPSRN